jgi:TPR repeat protein
MCSVGHCFQVGLGVDQDIDKAMAWFRRAASKMGWRRDAYGRTLCHVGSQINRHGVAAMFIAMGGDVNAM